MHATVLRRARPRGAIVALRIEQRAAQRRAPPAIIPARAREKIKQRRIRKSSRQVLWRHLPCTPNAAQERGSQCESHQARRLRFCADRLFAAAPGASPSPEIFIFARAISGAPAQASINFSPIRRLGEVAQHIMPAPALARMTRPYARGGSLPHRRPWSTDALWPAAPPPVFTTRSAQARIDRRPKHHHAGAERWRNSPPRLRRGRFRSYRFAASSSTRAAPSGLRDFAWNFFSTAKP